ncbi:MAG: PD40 domain-containing protein [Gemmatimonadetes bacterium]|nr:PD40 domain-containing protein [Gemmatimonadota bacterium]
MRTLLRAIRSAVLLAGAATTILLTQAAAGAAQYFGRNKVHYDSPDFRVLQTEHFEIHYYPEMQEAARDAARMAERWYQRLARLFQHEFAVKKPIILYADHPDFQQTNAISDVISEGTGGVTESLKDRVILPLTGSYKETDHVLGHELVHAFQYDIAKAQRGGGATAIGSLPLWLVEGMAEYLSVGRDDPHTAMWLRDAALREELPTLRQLTRDRRFFPYRYGQALWAYVAGRSGDEVVPELYRQAGRRGWEQAVASVIGMSEDSVSHEWITELRSTYLPLMQGRTHPRDAGKRILAPETRAGDMNLAPALSPDGRYVAFISERELFSVELFVADAQTGKVVKRLTRSAADPHYDALAFISSAGSWSPDGQKFVFVVYADGDNALAIADVRRGKIERQIRVPGVGAMSNPAWSPDGKMIAFSGSAGGITDLYLLDVASGQTERLTDDRYADLQPAWSPDGTTIAFVTDRGPGTNFQGLTYGPVRLALLDVASRRVRNLDLFADAKHITPQFSPDARSLYFISDADGFSDVYRVALATGEVFRVTRIATGVSGITALSPAMSVAQGEGRMLFSVFDGGRYVVYGLEAGEIAGQPVSREPVTSVAGVLPPATPRGDSFVSSYLGDPVTGLPATGEFEVTDYRASLQLDYVGQPTIGVAVNRFGTGVGGATALFFSDMLGNRNLGLAVQANGGVQDIGGQVVYQNLSSRWNWALAAGHIPYLLAYTSVGTGLVPVNGGSVPATVVEQIRQRVTVDQTMALVAYPLSATRRLEANAGVTRYSFDNEVERFAVSGGRLVLHEKEDLDAPDPLNLAQAAVAYVGDYSFFGFTSPVNGGRFRFEVEGTWGTISYQTLLADYRRYLYRRPITLAFRGLHYGRYGAGGNTDRLNPLFLGFETFVRGYAAESFEFSECTGADAQRGTCPEWERLFGSRLALFNVELRAPLFGTSEFGLIDFPWLPTDAGVFLDAGAAWGPGENLEFAFRRRTTERVPVFSTGLTARFNVLGFLVVEAYYAYPFQRPEKGWHWGFQIAPGW